MGNLPEIKNLVSCILYLVNHFYVAWRKTIRRLWKILTTHCKLLFSINSSEPIVYKLEKRCAKLICSCLNSHNCVIKNIALSTKSSMEFLYVSCAY